MRNTRKIVEEMEYWAKIAKNNSLAYARPLKLGVKKILELERENKQLKRLVPPNKPFFEDENNDTQK